MNLPKTTNKQQEILEYLYTYRFLNRLQIQALLQHKNKKTINVWLDDLRKKQYVEWIYSTDFLEKSKPAIYYLGINGVRYLRGTGKYPQSGIRKRYYESVRSEGFVSRSIFLADISIDLNIKTDGRVLYDCQTAAKYDMSHSEFHFINEIEAIHPDLCYAKHEGSAIKTYLLVFLDATLPRYRVRYHLKSYVELLDYNADVWRRLSGQADRPTVLFISPSLAELLYAKRRTRKLLESAPDREDIHIKFATIGEIKKSGVISKVWEEA